MTDESMLLTCRVKRRYESVLGRIWKAFIWILVRFLVIVGVAFIVIAVVAYVLFSYYIISDAAAFARMTTFNNVGIIVALAYIADVMAIMVACALDEFVPKKRSSVYLITGSSFGLLILGWGFMIIKVVTGALTFSLPYAILTLWVIGGIISYCVIFTLCELQKTHVKYMEKLVITSHAM
jgi:hypothetical protein